MQKSLRSIAAAFATWRILLALLTWLASSMHAHAQIAPGFVCPVDPFVYAEKCEKLARREQQRAERERYRVQHQVELERYRVQHPLRVSLVAQGDLFMLGLGNNYVAGFWGVAAGASLVYEIAPSWALRFDLLGRFGHGHISNWNVDYPGPIDTSAGYLGGVEVQGSMLRRIGVMYLGPVLSLGLLHLHDQTLHEQDFKDERDGDAFHSTVRVPSNASFLAGGVVLGSELTPSGQVGFNIRLTPGVWNDFHHFYLDFAFALTVKLWD
jgi:hypothetical protein